MVSPTDAWSSRRNCAHDTKGIIAIEQLIRHDDPPVDGICDQNIVAIDPEEVSFHGMADPRQTD
jgi:hypothetical protein